METKTAQILLGFVFLLVLLLKLFLSLQTPYFSEESYYYIRQAENIRHTGMPILNDELSYGGKLQVVSPLFYYILALGMLFLPEILALKFITVLLQTLLLIPSFLIIKKLTRSNKFALLTSIPIVFIPLLFSNGLNTVTPVHLTLLLFFFTIYYFMKLKTSPESSFMFVISLILFSLTSPFSLLLIPVFAIYLIILKSEKLKISPHETEAILFAIIGVLWINLLIFREAILFHGLNVLSQNIPLNILKNIFFQASTTDLILTIGIIPLILSVIAANYAFTRLKNRDVFFLISSAFIVFILVWLKFIQFQMGMLFFSIITLLLAGKGLHLTETYFLKLKLSNPNLLIYLIIGLIFLSSIIPSLILGFNFQSETSYDVVKALHWAEMNTPKDSTILSTIEEGNLITYFAKRKNLMDTNYLLVNNPEQKILDAEKIYTSPFKTTAIDLLTKHEIDYIMITEKTKENYNIKDLKYIPDECFTKVYDNNVKIYRSECILK